MANDSRLTEDRLGSIEQGARERHTLMNRVIISSSRKSDAFEGCHCGRHQPVRAHRLGSPAGASMIVQLAVATHLHELSNAAMESFP